MWGKLRYLLLYSREQKRVHVKRHARYFRVGPRVTVILVARVPAASVFAFAFVLTFGLCSCLLFVVHTHRVISTQFAQGANPEGAGAFRPLNRPRGKRASAPGLFLNFPHFSICPPQSMPPSDEHFRTQRARPKPLIQLHLYPL